MIVEFLGKKVSRRRGCPVCGSRGRTDYKIATTQTYYLPSGSVITFRIGSPVELPDDDGRFLLSIGDEFRERNTTEERV